MVAKFSPNHIVHFWVDWKYTTYMHLWWQLLKREKLAGGLYGGRGVMKCNERAVMFYNGAGCPIENGWGRSYLYLPQSGFPQLPFDWLSFWQTNLLRTETAIGDCQNWDKNWDNKTVVLCAVLSHPWVLVQITFLHSCPWMNVNIVSMFLHFC